MRPLFLVRTALVLAVLSAPAREALVFAPAPPTTTTTTTERWRFDGTERLYGAASMAALARARVAICGVGGVGSWTAEALARSGVGHLRLIDLDEVCVSNCNRQVHALESTIGRPKVSVLAARLRDINPSMHVESVLDFVDASNVEELCFPADVVVDAVDGATDKAHVLKACLARGVKVVVLGGAGGKTDPTRIQVKTNAPIKNSHLGGDRLLKALRRELRRLDLREGHASFVFSDETPRPPPDASLRRSGCDQAFGTAAFVTAAFGMAAAKAVVDVLLDSSKGSDGGVPPPSSSPSSAAEEEIRRDGAVVARDSVPPSDTHGDDDMPPNRRGDDAREVEEFIELDCPCSDFDD